MKPVANGPHNAQLRYRPEVDGLRGVAVLLVLAFHAWPQCAPAGFIGVDIFFVISGFLISGIIFGELQHGTFSFLHFYIRRVKRIFPALAVVLGFVAILGWSVLLPDEFEQLGKHIAAGAGFVSNIVLWKEAGYFDRAADLKPLLHLWSLGVEEQFYIGWPLLLSVLWKSRRRMRLLLVIVIGSFAANAHRVHRHEAETFYLVATRLWELGIGGLLAHWQYFSRKSAISILMNWSDGISVAGVSLLLAAVLFIDRHRAFPGWWALLPTLGTVLLIAAGERAWVNRHVFGSPPLVFVGLISYPLYLWHWPLLSFQRIVDGRDLLDLTKAQTLAVAFLLALLTYHWVEKPVRSLRSTTRVAAPWAACIIVLAVLGMLGMVQKIQPRSSGAGLDNIMEAAQGEFFPGSHLEKLAGSKGVLERQHAGRATVLFIGDSNIQQYYPRIDRLVSTHPQAAKTVVFASIGGCPPIPDVHGVHRPDCDRLLDKGIDYARRPEVDTVVFGANWIGYFVVDSYYLERDGTKRSLNEGPNVERDAFTGLAMLVDELVRAGKNVTLVLQSPVGPSFEPRGMISRTLVFPSFEQKVPRISTREIREQMLRVDDPLRVIADRTGATIIDPKDWLCQRETCELLSADGIPVYRDEAHLNPIYVRDHVTFLDDLVLDPAPDSIPPGLSR